MWKAMTDFSKMLKLSEVERRYILKLLKLTNGNVTKTAEVLGIGRATMYRRIQRLFPDFEKSGSIRRREAALQAERLRQEEERAYRGRPFVTL